MTTKSQTKHKVIPLNLGMKDGNRDNGSIVNLKFDKREKGILRPLVDFDYDTTVPNDFEPVKVIRAGGSVYALGEDSSNDIAVYKISSTGNLTFKAGGGTGISKLSDAVYYSNDDGNFIYMIDTGGDVSRYNTSSEVFDADVHTSFSGDCANAYSGHTHIVNNKIDDNLYFLTGEKINILDNVTYTDNAFALNKNLDYERILSYDKYILAVGSGDTGSYYVQFWDRDTSKTTLSKSIEVVADRIGAIGVLKGKLMLVRATSTYGNIKEYEGQLELLSYSGGEGFNISVSKVMIYDSQVTTIFNGIVDDSFMVYVGGDEKNNIVKDGLYEISYNGNMRLVNYLSTDQTEDRFYSTIKVYNKLYTAVRYDTGNGDEYTVGIMYDNNSSSFSDFEKESSYVTSFMFSPDLRHEITEFTVAYQKLYDGSEEGYVYYRVSPLDDWTELTHIKFSKEDKTSRGTLYRKKVKFNLPEYNEIELKFTSKYGLTYLGAGVFYKINDYE